MSERFIKYIPSETSLQMMAKKPFAFLLLTLIAERARRTYDDLSGLEIGEAFIGDHKLIGASRGQYRSALEYLVEKKFLVIVETCRTRKRTTTDSNKTHQKTTTATTTIGTKVKLIDTRVWDVNLFIDNHRVNHPTTTEQPPKQPRTKNDKERKEVKETIIEEKIVRPPFRSTLLHEEDLNAMVAMTESNGRTVNIDNFTLWIKTHELDELIWICNKMLDQKKITKTPAAIMQWMLTKELYHKSKREETNKAFVEHLKLNHHLNSLTITKQYARDENTGYDFQFWWDCDMFERTICEKFNINNEKQGV